MIIKRNEKQISNLSILFIVIGGTGFFHVQIRRRYSKETLAKLGRPNLLNERVPTKFIIEVTKTGRISIWSAHNPFEPLLTAQDDHVLPIKYLSFASGVKTLNQFYFNCIDDNKDAPFEMPENLRSRLGEDSEEVLIVDEKKVDVIDDKYDLKSCQHMQVKDNEYKKLIPLSDLVGELKKSDVLNVPLLIQGEKNAHIVLTTSENPNWETDNVYELIIGGWDDTRIAIRRKRNSEVLQEEELSNSISKIAPTKFTLSITPSGEIVVRTDLSAYKPLIWASDPDLLPVKYIGFASNETEVIDYYYGCPSFKKTDLVISVDPIKVVDEHKVTTGGISTSETAVTTTTATTSTGMTAQELLMLSIHPMLANPILYTITDLKSLAYYSQHYETWKDTFESFLPVREDMRPNGFMLRFPFYVQGTQNAHVLLSTHSDLTVEDAKSYEIRLGAEGNTLSQIVVRSTQEVLAKIAEQNLLSETKPLRAVIELSNSKLKHLFIIHIFNSLKTTFFFSQILVGLLKVYTSHNPFAPLLQAILPPLTQIRYLSFASPHRTQFYYDVDEEDLLTKPVTDIVVMENLDKVKHPLLSVVDYPVGFSDLFFKKYFKTYVTTEEQSDKYVHFLKLTDVQDSPQKGYLLRWPFYVQGGGNAHILLSVKENPTLEDNAYEIIIGGLENTRVEIRKRINGATLADAHIDKVLNPYRKIKFVLEVSKDGDIKLYSEDQPYRPLVKAYDPNPVPFQYISLKNTNNAKLHFYYGNPPHDTQENIVAELLADSKDKLTVNPLLQYYNNVVTKVNIMELLEYSTYLESWSEKYEKFLPVEKDYKPKGYYLRFPVFLQGKGDAHILLSSVPSPGLKDPVYEIVIGANDNALSYIRKQLDPTVEPVVFSYEQHILSELVPVKFIIEVSVDGMVRVFASHNPFVPLLEYLDPEPIQVSHVSFTSPSRVEVFYNVNEKLIIKEPTVVTNTWQIDVSKLIKHPLLNVQDYPVGLAEPCKFIILSFLC